MALPQRERDTTDPTDPSNRLPRPNQSLQSYIAEHIDDPPKSIAEVFHTSLPSVWESRRMVRNKLNLGQRVSEKSSKRTKKASDQPQSENRPPTPRVNRQIHFRARKPESTSYPPSDLNPSPLREVRRSNSSSQEFVEIPDNTLATGDAKALIEAVLKGKNLALVTKQFPGITQSWDVLNPIKKSLQELLNYYSNPNQPLTTRVPMPALDGPGIIDDWESERLTKTVTQVENALKRGEAAELFKVPEKKQGHAENVIAFFAKHRYRQAPGREKGPLDD